MADVSNLRSLNNRLRYNLVSMSCIWKKKKLQGLEILFVVDLIRLIWASLKQNTKNNKNKEYEWKIPFGIKIEQVIKKKLL